MPLSNEELLEELKTRYTLLEQKRKELIAASEALRVAQVYRRGADGTIYVLQIVSYRPTPEGLVIEVDSAL